MIRKATNQDIDKIMLLTAACAKHMISKGIYQWNNHYPSKNAFKTDVKRDELFVYESNNDILGCIVISRVKDDEYLPIKWLSDDENNIYIHRLAVHPLSKEKVLHNNSWTLLKTSQ